MNGQFVARLPRASTIASSLFAMNVSAIQAMPNRAIIATMPDLKIGVPGMSLAFTCANTTISAATVSMIIWISGVTDIGSTPPPSAATVGRMSSTKPNTQIARTPVRKIATLRLANGSSTISAGGAGGLISPAARRRWYSGSASSSFP